MRRLVYALPLVAIVLVGAVGILTVSLAHTIAGIVMVLAPFALKFVKLQGPAMVIVSYAVALAVAVLAGFASGEVTTSSFNLANIVVTSGALWAVMQGVFQLFKDSKTFGSRLR